MTKSNLTAILHIGLHKTGTTSFQAVMHNHRESFLEQGLDPVQTNRGIKDGRAKHGDLAFSVIRTGVLDERPKDMLYNFDQGACFERTKAELAAYITASNYERFLMSTEALSLLRTREEVERLKELFPANVTTFVAIVVLRDKEEWLASFKNQAIKAGIEPSQNPTSAFYFEDDTWLLDFDHLIEIFRDAFDEVTVLDYDPEDMVGRLTKAVGVALPVNTKAYRRNVSPRFPVALRALRLLSKRVFGSEDQGIRSKIRDWREKRRL